MGIKVFIADDQELLASALATILNSQDDIEVIGTGSTGEAALTHAHHVDLMILDVRMPTVDGITALKEIKKLDNPPKVIMLTTFNSPTAVEEAIVAGADGFLLKDVDPDYLINAVRTVARGDAVVSAGITNTILSSWKNLLTNPGAHSRVTTLPAHVQQGLSLLTPRETHVLLLLSQGLSNQEIADKLYISITTVKTHISSLLSKLNARDRVALVIIAREAGIETMLDERS